MNGDIGSISGGVVEVTAAIILIRELVTTVRIFSVGTGRPRRYMLCTGIKETVLYAKRLQVWRAQVERTFTE
jgi:phosphoenolpyruvate-protein kinase (PTS system EI component)